MAPEDMMRVLISSVGTRGDVQPALGLAREARRLGHDVRMCVPPNFVQEAQGLGVEARSIGIEMRPPKPGVPPAPIPDLIADQFVTIASAAADRDIIVGAGVHQYAARSVATLRDIPCIIAAYAPVSLPSTDLAPPGQPEGNDPADIRRLWGENRKAWNARSLDRVNANRARLGLAPVDDVLPHILGGEAWLAADPLLAPAPSTPGIRITQTGAWLLPDATPLPSELEAFLAAGEPPVYLGLGSMPAAGESARKLVEAARAAGRRAILSRGWAGLDRIDDAPDCIVVGDINHQALFPRVAAIVHHGGAGTTTAAALAGTPQIATPMYTDQFYFGRRMTTLGVGLGVPFAELTADRLASALRQVLDPAIAARAREIATKIVANGAALAAQHLAV